jgi:hypothetical protein
MPSALPSAAAAFLVLLGMTLAAGPGWANATETPLVLETAIPLPDVSGRIDHMALDAKRRRLIIAELGNHTVDVVDLSAGKVVHRITGLPEPQGVGYSEQADLVVVANAGDGSVRLFGAENFAPVETIELGDDADNVRIDRRDRLVVVGFGSGGLALIEPASRTKVAEIRLPAHPEGFQIDPQTGRVFVNLPDAGQIAVVDLSARRTLGSWPTDGLGGNFPMALDPASGLLALVFRKPPVLALLDHRSGAVRDKVAACGDADDVFFDTRRSRIYISCGAGTIAVFRIAAGRVQPTASVRTAIGARTSLFAPDLDRLFVGRRGDAQRSAAILVYRPVP